MGHIRVLSDPLIDRIAAGEVVERPASVVKELVENSLDAGAVAIDVLLRGGGKQLIQVVDDGSGMDRDDALLAVERHATSKLAGPEDLERIRTLGFRGEALSSIAAVSRFDLLTAIADGEGTEVTVHGGRMRSVRQVGLPRGTTIRVDRLFFNTPARRKFLRGDSTELAHALRWLTRYALVHADRRFHLAHDERRLLDLAPAGDTLERIVQIHGRVFADRLLPFDREIGDLRVRGYAGRPVEALPRRDAQHLFVNGRAVQDRVLTHAIQQAYANTMPQGRHPALFLFVDLDPGSVDVNVHPQKTEVRFREASRVHDTVRDALVAALSRPHAVPSLSDLRPRGARIPQAPSGYLELREGTAGPRGPVGRERDTPALVAEPRTPGPLPGPVVQRRGATALAQFRESYIVAQDPDGMILVDQHAAHERVLFEEYLRAAEDNRVGVQRLMFPATFELAPHELAVLESELEEFRRLGFEVEAFGGSTVRVDAVPAVAAAVDAEVLLRELLGQASTARAAASEVGSLRRRLVTTAACQAAIKIHHPLTAPAMQSLLDDLFRTDNPTTCPHGRPILFELSLGEIERAFRRR